MSVFDRDKWQEIFGTMRKHKLRTALTALGVFWGIFMLIFALGMGKGLENGVFRDFGNRAKNTLIVWPTRTSLPYKGFQPGRSPRFQLDDIYALRSNLKEIEFIAPRNSMSAFVSRKEKNDTYEIRGELTDMIKIEALVQHEGRYINQKDVDDARKVGVIGTRIKEVLFDDEDCLGKYIQINGIEFRVIGVFGPEQVKPWTESDMTSVVIPITTMQKTFGRDQRIDYFICSAARNVRVSQLEPKVRGVLKQRHYIDPQDPEGVGGFNLEAEFLGVVNLFTGIKFFLWFVGIGTLLAGIVGVSNIMLIIVKERTKEIGIRKAMGATPGSIINMILTESVFITAVSGYLGLLTGTLLIAFIDYMMISNGVETDNFHHPEVNLIVGIGSVLILVIAGTVAGLVPAIQASRVNPVDALKDE